MKEQDYSLIQKINQKHWFLFLNKPLISYQLQILKSLNINNIGIITGYKAEKFSKLNYRTFHNKFFDSTNMVESLFMARSFLEQAKNDVIISYGDIVYEKKKSKNYIRN